MQIHKKNEPFDMTQSHEFEPSQEFSEYAQKQAQKICLEDSEKTEQMRNCKHDRKIRFSVGVPSNIIACCDCSFWMFF